VEGEIMRDGLGRGGSQISVDFVILYQSLAVTDDDSIWHRFRNAVSYLARKQRPSFHIHLAQTRRGSP